MCRENGLESKRRCGFIGAGEGGAGPPVWSRGDVSLDTCPKSYITAESEGLVEEFFVRRRLGGLRAAEMSARQVDAFVVLENTLREVNDGRQNSRRVDGGV